MSVITVKESWPIKSHLKHVSKSLIVDWANLSLDLCPFRASFETSSLQDCDELLELLGDAVIAARVIVIAAIVVPRAVRRRVGNEEEDARGRAP